MNGISVSERSRVSSLPAVSKHTSSPAQSFLDAMNAANADTTSSAVGAERPTVEENAPLERYQSITGRSVETGNSPKDTTKSCWTDETLAFFVGREKYPIDTTKTINWESSGKHKLTSEEIAQLKEKYDVTDLNPQEYYDLMSDLTHMEVLSGDDVMGVYLATAGSAISLTERSLLPKGTYGFRTGNMPKIFAHELDLFMKYWDQINSYEYNLINSHLSADKKDMIRSATLKDIQTRQKMFNVMNQLQ